MHVQKPWSPEDKDTLARLWHEHGGRCGTIGRIMGRSKNSIIGKSNVMGLQFHGGRARTIAADDPAALYAETIFPDSVKHPEPGVLKSGANQRKLGPVITKGKWKGFPLFSLTLQERATCPRSCDMWRQCYGNNMQNAKRYAHGGRLEAQIWDDLHGLQRQHCGGFVVRLHTLGEFYSVEYVHLWERALDAFPALHVFGYTHRRTDDPIGAAVEKLRDWRWDRFAVRSSDGTHGPRAVVVESAEKAGCAIVCPAQTVSRKVVQCSSCALCWAEGAMHRDIAFVAH